MRLDISHDDGMFGRRLWRGEYWFLPAFGAFRMEFSPPDEGYPPVHIWSESNGKKSDASGPVSSSEKFYFSKWVVCVNWQTRMDIHQVNSLPTFLFPLTSLHPATVYQDDLPESTTVIVGPHWNSTEPGFAHFRTSEAYSSKSTSAGCSLSSKYVSKKWKTAIDGSISLQRPPPLADPFAIHRTPTPQIYWCATIITPLLQ